MPHILFPPAICPLPHACPLVACPQSPLPLSPSGAFALPLQLLNSVSARGMEAVVVAPTPDCSWGWGQSYSSSLHCFVCPFHALFPALCVPFPSLPPTQCAPSLHPFPVLPLLHAPLPLCSTLRSVHTYLTLVHPFTYARPAPHALSPAPLPAINALFPMFHVSLSLTCFPMLLSLRVPSPTIPATTLHPLLPSPMLPPALHATSLHAPRTPTCCISLTSPIWSYNSCLPSLYSNLRQGVSPSPHAEWRKKTFVLDSSKYGSIFTVQLDLS